MKTVPGEISSSVEGCASQQKVLLKIPQKVMGDGWGRLVFRCAELWWESPRQNVTRSQNAFWQLRPCVLALYDLIHESTFCRFWGKHETLIAIYRAGGQTGIPTDRLKWFKQFWIWIGFRLKILWEFICIDRIPWVIMLVNQHTNQPTVLGKK